MFTNTIGKLELKDRFNEEGKYMHLEAEYWGGAMAHVHHNGWTHRMPGTSSSPRASPNGPRNGYGICYRWFLAAGHCQHIHSARLRQARTDLIPI